MAPALSPASNCAGALAGLQLRQLRPNSGPLPWAQAWARISTRREHQGAIITDGQSAASQQIRNSLFDRRTELSAGCLEPQHSAHNCHHLFATRAVILVNDAERGEPKLGWGKHLRPAE